MEGVIVWYGSRANLIDELHCHWNWTKRWELVTCRYLFLFLSCWSCISFWFQNICPLWKVKLKLKVCKFPKTTPSLINDPKNYPFWPFWGSNSGWFPGFRLWLGCINVVAAARMMGAELLIWASRPLYVLIL